MWVNTLPALLDESQGIVILGTFSRELPVPLAGSPIAKIEQTASQTASRVGIVGKVLWREKLTSPQWEIFIRVNGATTSVFPDFSQYQGIPKLQDLGDVFVDVPSSALTKIEVGLRFTSAVDGRFVLPCCLIDGVDIQEDLDTILTENRYPYPGQDYVPSTLPTWQFDLVDYDGGAPSSDLTITVNSVVVYTASNDIFGETTIDTIGSHRKRVTIDRSTEGPWSTPGPGGLQTISITGPGGISDSWSFTESASLAPSIDSVIVRSPNEIEIEFSTRITDGKDVLNPGAYDVYPEVLPAFPPTVQTVEQLTDYRIRLTLDDHLTVGTRYTITAASTITDGGGLALSESGRTMTLNPLEFLVERNFDVFSMFSCFNRRSDKDQHLLNLSRVIEDLFGQLMLRNDYFYELLDPRKAPIEIIQAKLQDLGSAFMFPFPMTELEQRRLTLEIAGFQELVGTVQGITRVIKFFTGIDVTIFTMAELPYWTLSESILGEGTVLSPPFTDSVWLTLWVKLPVDVLKSSLSEETIKRIRLIVLAMAPAHAKYGGIKNG